MRRLLALALLLPLAACSSSRGSASGGYAISEGEDGDVNIVLSEGASPETLMAALMEAADRIEWEPPEVSGGLRQIETRDLGGDGTIYRYALPEGRFDVFVYRYAQGVDVQVEETLAALASLKEDGRIDAFELVGRETMSVEWEGGDEPLHRIAFSEKLGGKPYDSFMYLLEDGAWWVKVRASYPQGRFTLVDLDAMVVGLLAEEEE